MTIKSILLGGLICASVIAAADAFAVFDATVRCDAYTSATGIVPPPRRADRGKSGDDRRSRRMRSNPESEETQLRGDSAVSTTPRVKPSEVDSTAVNVRKR